MTAAPRASTRIRSTFSCARLGVAVGLLAALCTTSTASSAPVDPEECWKTTSWWEYDLCMGAHWESNFYDGEECSGRSVVHPCNGEEHHWVATAFAPSATPFVVRGFSYLLSNTAFPNIRCDATLEHRVDVFVAGTTPPASPQIVESFVVPADPSANTGDQRIELYLSKYLVLDAGEYVYISIQNEGEVDGPGCASGGYATCVVTCANEEEQDTCHWSNRDEAPFSWATLSSFGIHSTAVLDVWGYRVP